MGDDAPNQEIADHGNHAHPTESSDQPRNRCGHRGRGGIAAILVTAIVAGAAGGYIGKSFAQGRGAFAGRASIMAADPAKMNQRVERFVKHFAVEVDATPEQQQKLTAIARDAATELAPLRARVQAARKQAVELVGAASVDRAAIENCAPSRSSSRIRSASASRRRSQTPPKC